MTEKSTIFDLELIRLPYFGSNRNFAKYHWSRGFWPKLTACNFWTNHRLKHIRMFLRTFEKKIVYGMERWCILYEKILIIAVYLTSMLKYRDNLKIFMKSGTETDWLWLELKKKIHERSRHRTLLEEKLLLSDLYMIRIM